MVASAKISDLAGVRDITLFIPSDGVFVVTLRLKIKDLDHFLAGFNDFSFFT
jgi:hypothetical protein